MPAKYGYVGNSPDNSPVVIARQLFEPTVDTTQFIFAAGYNIGYVDVYLNGARLFERTDYIAQDGVNVYLNVAAQNGDVVEIVAYKAFNLTLPPTVGVTSAGLPISNNITTLNFVGAGNTFKAYGNTVDISIQGGGAGVSTTGILTCRGIANSSVITDSIIMPDFYNEGTNYGMIGPIQIAVGATVTVGVGVSYAIL